MLEYATNIAKHKTNKKLDRTKLIKLLPKIKKMTLQKSDECFPILQEKLIECGVGFNVYFSAKDLKEVK